MKTALTRFLILAFAWLAFTVPAGAACWQWSKTAASNATVDPSINWAEGMAPSAVNDSARAMMARSAECRDDISGALTTTGTATAYAATSNQGTIASPPGDGQQIVVKMHVANGVAAGLALDGGTSFPIQTSPGAAVGGGVLVLGAPYRLTFSTAASAWLLQDFYNSTIPAGSIVTTMLADANITYAKIQNVTNNRVLGNFSGGAAPVSEYSLSGATVAGSNIAIPFPPPGSFKNLVIKVTSNTTASVAADFVTTTNGATFQTTAVACTLNMATTGAGGLDTGAIAAASWYAVWINVKADGTTSCTASLEFTPTAPFLSHLPATYTHYARVGALRTAPGVAQLMGTWQFGRRAQYVLGLAQTTGSLPVIKSGSNGTADNVAPTWVGVSVATVVPTTASHISLVATNASNNGSGSLLQIAPSSSYGGQGTTNPPPLALNNNSPNSVKLEMMLEAATIALAQGSNGLTLCSGWEDNI